MRFRLLKTALCLIHKGIGFAHSIQSLKMVIFTALFRPFSSRFSRSVPTLCKKRRQTI
ncbi:hypothetical protein HMPREF1990_01945 [Porphyromonas gingivalis W4087]|nr:hypothetical protein HMPREF1990_01945 [Porphyromonas gingivalis W4087]